MKFILAALVFISTSALAQTLPQGSGDPLKDICTSFMDQSGQGVSGDRNKLCSCLVQQTQARLTRQEMEIYAKAGATGQQPPPAIMQKVIEVATTCLTQAQ